MDSKQRKALDNLNAKREELERVSKRDRSETDAYLKANRAVIDAEKDAKKAGVSWWRR
jgi:hypothetical protein